MIHGNPETEIFEPVKRPPMLRGGQTFASVTDKISGLVLTTWTPGTWIGFFCLSVILLGVFSIAVSYLFWRGVGIWGIKIPVAWGFAISLVLTLVLFVSSVTCC